MKLKDMVHAYELEVTDEFQKCKEEELEYIYNGAGPDWLPAWGREVLSDFLKLFAPAFIVHDFDYSRSDKTLKSFHEANNRMLRNMKKILDTEYPFSMVWTWRTRARWYLRMKAAFNACEEFGESAWMD